MRALHYIQPDVAVEFLFNIFISGVAMVTAYLLYLGLEAYEARQASKKPSAVAAAAAAGQPSRSSAAETETRRVKLEINVDKPES